MRAHAWTGKVSSVKVSCLGGTTAFESDNEKIGLYYANQVKRTNTETINLSKVTDHLVINMRGLSRGVERRRTQRALKANGRMSDRTLACSDRAWSRNGRTSLATATSRRLLLRLHLRGNQLRIRQRVSIFPQGTWCFVILVFYLHHYQLPSNWCRRYNMNLGKRYFFSVLLNCLLNFGENS